MVIAVLITHQTQMISKIKVHIIVSYLNLELAYIMGKNAKAHLSFTLVKSIPTVWFLASGYQDHYTE